MQKIRFIFSIFIGVSSLLSCIPTYASIENCPWYAVHCAYLTGLSDKLDDGRYIKLRNKKINYTMCLNGTAFAMIDRFNAEKYLGNNGDEYSICSDANGTHCQLIGIDTFVVSKSNDQHLYAAQPKYYNVDLSSVKNNYPKCIALFAKNMIS